MSEMKKYLQWSNFPLEDKDLLEELAAISDDQEAITDRFYRDLAFGTAGIRGVIGAGTNRLNLYTIRRATQGLADYLTDTYNTASVAIGYDSRIKSDLFAKEAARVLAANGVKVYLYKELMPVPCLSFAVRELGCNAGIMVTASHNPAKYNGYKCYGSDGCQMTSQAADAVMYAIGKVDILHGAKLIDFDEAMRDGEIEYIADEIVDKYIAKVKAQTIYADACKDSPLTVIYTPLNGAGNKPVRRILDLIGIKNISIVKAQENPDGMFPTCPFPNPEIKEALNLGLEQAKSENADLLIATDPDCDRVGIAVRDHHGDYVLVSGNEVGALLFAYICEGKTTQSKMPKNPIVVKTIVTTDMVLDIAEDYGVECLDVLTGFKYIGEQIAILGAVHEEDRFLLGFEESYGYLAGTYVRDKDAVVGSMLICEMAAFYAKQGKSLLDVLQALYEKYGNYHHTQQSFTCEGASGMQQMSQIMEQIRNNPPTNIADLEVIAFADYGKSIVLDTKTNEPSKIYLPKSEVLCFELEGNASVILRPSGTEPKIKAYYTAIAKTKEEAVALEQSIKKEFTEILGF